MKSNYEPLGKHIRFVDYRNSEEVTSTVLGISIDKEFMPSVANLIGTDLSRYKLISKGLFACNPMHVGRDERLPIALYEKVAPAIVSPAYFMFEIIDRDVLNEEYLMMWFRRPEFDRECWFMTDGSVRGGITRDDLCRIKLPVVPLERQLEIVKAYKTIQERITLKRKINDNLKQQVSLLYQSWFEDFRITNGVCPENWSYQEFSSIANIASGKRPPVKSDICNQETPISIVGAASVMGFTSEANHTGKILVIGRVGTHGVVQRFNIPCWTSDNTLVITSPYFEFTNQILQRIDYSSMNRGSTQPLITQGDMKKVVVLVPDEDTLAKFEKFAGSLMDKWEANNNENVKLASLRDILLPKLMSNELDVSEIDL